MMKDKIYLAVTNDRFKLPVFIADTQSQLSEMIGVQPSTISQSIKHGGIVQNKYRVVAVEFSGE